MTPPANSVLDGQVAVVTGGGRGIGAAIALALGAAGADLVLAGRSRAALEDVASVLSGDGHRVSVVPTDVTDAQAVETLIAAAVAEFGHLDILVNNAGILHESALLETTDEQWDAVMTTNLRSTFVASRAAARHFVDQRSGKIINIASNFAFKGVPRFAVYCASKAAVVSLTKSLAVELAPFNVQVNAIAPGYFNTEMTTDTRANTELHSRILRQIPARRMGEPEDLGPWAVLMADPNQRFMTGETVIIDGGQVAR